VWICVCVCERGVRAYLIWAERRAILANVAPPLDTPRHIRVRTRTRAVRAATASHRVE
jgi:hypothetical protein